MQTPPSGISAVSSALPVPAEIFENSPTGTFQYYFDTESFHWSDEMLAIHGYEPGEVVPTYELGMSHILPDLRGQGAAYWAEVRMVGGPLSTYLTLRDARGSQRQVLVVADRIRYEEEVVGIWGIMIDVTKSVRVDSYRLADAAVAASARGRAVIEQAKGIVMGRAGVTADQAFHLISQHSQDTNRKVMAVSRAIVEQASADGAEDDHALGTARAFVASF